LSNSLAAFKQKAEEFNDRLSSLFTRTITDRPLKPIIRSSVAYITFEGAERTGDRPSVELENGCQIRVSHTIRHSPEVPSEVTTVEYVYAYALGPDPKNDWLVRYDYSPDRPMRYPVAHVHFNGRSDAYDRFPKPEDKELYELHFPTDRITVEDFIEHLILEYDVPTHNGRKAALDLLAKSRREFHKEYRTRWPTYDSPG
jgi:hypothetical protein